MKKRCLYILVILALAGYAKAESVFSSRGLGLNYNLPNARSLALGGSRLSIYDQQNISSVNPAVVSALDLTSLSIQYIHEFNKAEDETASANTDYGNLQAFDFIVPLGKGLGFAAGLHPVVRADYYLYFENADPAVPFTKTIKSKGGINEATLSIAWNLHSKIKAGLTGRYYFGSYSEKWAVDYAHSGFSSTKDEFKTKTSGAGMTAGIIAAPIQNLTFGLIYTPESLIDTETELSALFQDSLSLTEGSINFPASWGAGLTYTLPGIGLITAELRHQAWDNLEINDKPAERVKSGMGYSAGIEILRSRNPYASYGRRTAFRIGLFQTPLPVTDNHGDAIKEKGFSAGLGLPMMMNKAIVDLAFSMSTRGSISKSHLKETIYRISVSISGTEKWFQRRY